MAIDEVDYIQSSESDHKTHFLLLLGWEQFYFADTNIITRKYKVDVEFRDLGFRHLEEELNPETAVLTLYIITSQGYVFQAANQRGCVAELYAALRGHKLQGPQSEVITVEVVGWELWENRCIARVEASNPFHQAWESHLRQSFLNFLNMSTKLVGMVH